MIRLAFLLLGARALRPHWRQLCAAGFAWIVLGLVILVDLGDGELAVVLDTLAIFLGIHGVVAIGAAVLSGLRRHWVTALRGLLLVLGAVIIVTVAWERDVGVALAFGGAFLADGILRIVSALVVHGRRWRLGIAAGAVEVVLAAAILAGWPLPHLLIVPLCVALLLLTSGYSLLRLALELRRLPEGVPVTALPLFAARNWQADPAPPALHHPDAEAREGTLIVHVWTAVGSADHAARRPLVDRYIAAVDKNGVVSTGHSALEVPPDLYVSHYPAVEIDHHPTDLRVILNAGHQNDVPGRFQPSLEIEAAAWCMPDQNVTFHRFNETALRGWWAGYSRSNTYNLTARNCSTTVIQALDAATEGVAYRGRPWRDLLRLLGDPNFWLLWIVRGRAEAMTWTPGLVLDYARLLEKVLEHGGRTWLSRLRAARVARDGFAHADERTLDLGRTA